MLDLTDLNAPAQDSKGNTPLHYAAGYGRTDVIAALLEAGCSGRTHNSKGHTPYELVKWVAPQAVHCCMAPSHAARLQYSCPRGLAQMLM